MHLCDEQKSPEPVFPQPTDATVTATASVAAVARVALTARRGECEVSKP
jgi:hypothetical protein